MESSLIKKTNESKDKIFALRMEIKALLLKRPSNDRDHWGMTPKEYIRARSEDLRQFLNIRYEDLSLSMEKSKGWYNMVRAEPKKGKNVVILSHPLALRLELITFGYISREYSVSREYVAEARRYGVEFPKLPDLKSPTWFDEL